MNKSNTKITLKPEDIVAMIKEIDSLSKEVLAIEKSSEALHSKIYKAQKALYEKINNAV